MGQRFLRPQETVEDADWIHLAADEEVRWTGRPSQYTIVVSVIGGGILALLGVALSLWLLPVAEAATVPRWIGFSPLLLTVIGIWRALFAYLNWVRLLYVITDEEIYVKHGLISRNVTQVRLDRVQNTSFDQSILERILHYGDVRIYTAGTSTEDITLENVPNPEDISQLLTELLSDRAGGRYAFD